MVITAIPVPALQQLVESEFGGAFEVDSGIADVAQTPTKIVGHDFERMSLVFINVGTELLVIAPSNNVSSTQGIIMLQNGSSVSLNAKDDLVLVGHEWYGIVVPIIDQPAFFTSPIYYLDTRRYRVVP